MVLQAQIDKATGSLAKLESSQFDRLEFTWEGISFSAASKKLGGGGMITLKADLGRLYFTIENQAERSQAIERIYSTNRGIDGAYHIKSGGLVSFESLTRTSDMKTGENLMSALTLILLEAESHLRVIRTHLKPIS